MPRRSARLHILDMIDAIQRIQNYLEGIDMQAFSRREIVFDAVTLNFEVLGESAARLEPFLRDQHPDLPWDQLRGLRNRIAHGYSSVRPEQLYQIAREQLPALRLQLESILPTLS